MSCTLSPFGTLTQDVCNSTTVCGTKWRCAKDLIVQNGERGEKDYAGIFHKLGDPLLVWDGTYDTAGEVHCWTCDVTGNEACVPTTNGENGIKGACDTGSDVCRYVCDGSGGKRLTTQNDDFAKAFDDLVCVQCAENGCTYVPNGLSVPRDAIHGFESMELCETMCTHNCGVDGTHTTVYDGSGDTLDALRCYTCDSDNGQLVPISPTLPSDRGEFFASEQDKCRYTCDAEGGKIFAPNNDLAVPWNDVKCWSCGADRCTDKGSNGTVTKYGSYDECNMATKCGWGYAVNDAGTACELTDSDVYEGVSKAQCETDNKIGWKYGCFTQYACEDGVCMGVPDNYNGEVHASMQKCMDACVPAPDYISYPLPPDCLTLPQNKWEIVRDYGSSVNMWSLGATTGAFVTMNPKAVVESRTFSTSNTNFAIDTSFVSAVRTWFTSLNGRINIGFRRIAPSRVEIVFEVTALGNQPYSYNISNPNFGFFSTFLGVGYLETSVDCFELPSVKFGVTRTSSTTLAWDVLFRPQPPSKDNIIDFVPDVTFPRIVQPYDLVVDVVVQAARFNTDGVELDASGCELSPYGTFDTADACNRSTICGASWRCSDGNETDIVTGESVAAGLPIRAMDGVHNNAEDCVCWTCDGGTSGPGTACVVDREGNGEFDTQEQCSATECGMAYGCGPGGVPVLQQNGIYNSKEAAMCWKCRGDPGPDSRCVMVNEGGTDGTYYDQIACLADASAQCSWGYGCSGDACIITQDASRGTSKYLCEMDSTAQCGWGHGCFTHWGCVDGACVGVNEDDDHVGPRYDTESECVAACGSLGSDECNVMDGTWILTRSKSLIQTTRESTTLTFTKEPSDGSGSEWYVSDQNDDDGIPIIEISHIVNPSSGDVFIAARGRIYGFPNTNLKYQDWYTRGTSYDPIASYENPQYSVVMKAQDSTCPMPNVYHLGSMCHYETCVMTDNGPIATLTLTRISS